MLHNGAQRTGPNQAVLLCQAPRPSADTRLSGSATRSNHRFASIQPRRIGRSPWRVARQQQGFSIMAFRLAVLNIQFPTRNLQTSVNWPHVPFTALVYTGIISLGEWGCEGSP